MCQVIEKVIIYLYLIGVFKNIYYQCKQINPETVTVFFS